jgi:hypothetical protein
MIYHTLQGFTNATSQTDMSITSYEEAILTWLQNRDNCCFSPGSWDQVLWPYTAVHGQ